MASISLGARIIEKHFVVNKNIGKGPDFSSSMDYNELKQLIKGSKSIFRSLGKGKKIISDEKSTAKFAFASVVAKEQIEYGEKITEKNICLKRPGNGDFSVNDLKKIIGKFAKRKILKNYQLKKKRLKLKKIIFVTATRADYGKLKSIIISAQKFKKFDVSIFVTGMHNVKLYGNTYQLIKKDKIRNIKLFSNQSFNNNHDDILSKTIIGFSKYVKKIKPDLVIIHGDRTEPLACAIVCCLNNIKVAHFEGGELSGTVDEIFRHSISKLCNIHFVTNKIAKKD